METKITYADIYKSFWECRNFELSHYWQRAIFLTAFLTGCFAGYGGFVISCLTSSLCEGKEQLFNMIAFAIALVGLMLSLLWIMMAKGSKTWYERYESAITAFVNKYSKNNKVFEEESGKIAGFACVQMDTFDAEPISDWLWKPCGGTYSVSRINIALGHISVIIWSVLLVGHILIAKHSITTLSKLKEVFHISSAYAIYVAVAVGVLLLFWIYTHLALKSGNLEENS